MMDRAESGRVHLHDQSFVLGLAFFGQLKILKSRIIIVEIYFKIILHKIKLINDVKAL